jgi:hypothetical protein
MWNKALVNSLSYYPSFCMEGLGKTTKYEYVIQDSASNESITPSFCNVQVYNSLFTNHNIQRHTASLNKT